MTPTLQITHLVDPTVLQHVQDSFASQKALSLLMFDTRGEKLTRPSSFCPLSPALTPILGPFLEFILTNPPHFADLGLRDGNTVFASFFNGIFHRAILPVMVQRQALGAVQLVTVNDLDSFDAGRWRYILDGFSWNDVSYLAFLDSQPRMPLAELDRSTTALKTRLTEMLESGFSRYKKQQSGATPPGWIGQTSPELVTNRVGDIISASLSMAGLLHYDSVEEMIGLNAVEHLTLDAARQGELHEALAQGESETLTEALVQTKDGLLLRVTWHIFLEKNDEGHEVGLRWQIQRSTQVRTSVPDGIQPPSGRESMTARGGSPFPRKPPAAKTVPDSESAPLTGETAAPPPSPLPAESPTGGGTGENGGGKEEAENPTGEGAGAISPDMLGFMDELRYPLFAVDSDNRILVWNRQMVELLRISPQAVANLDFANLLVGDSQKMWHQWLFEFRVNPDAAEAKPAGLLYVLDNSGEVYAISLELAKTDLPSGRVISAAVRSCEKAAPPPPALAYATGYEKPRREAKEPEEEPADSGGGSAGTLTAFSAVIRRQWLPFHEQLTQIIRPHEMLEAKRENARRLLDRADTLSRLMQQLNYIAGDFELNRAPVPIVRILRYAANIQERLFIQPANILWLLPDEGVLVQGDTIQLYHGMVYLLDYVRRVMEEGTTLRIRVGTAAAGEGMPGWHEDVKMAVIEADYTDHQSPWPEPENWAQNATTENDFALAAMQAIILAHQGAVRIMPLDDERRSFQLFLPLALTAARPAAGGATVLVIDDEPGIVQMNALMLEHAGYSVLSAISGSEGLRLLREHSGEIGAILLDWQLPDITCQDMAAEIGRISKAPLILASGFLPDAEIKGVIERYDVRFLQKPYTLNLLVKTVAGAIGGESPAAKPQSGN